MELEGLVKLYGQAFFDMPVNVNVNITNLKRFRRGLETSPIMIDAIQTWGKQYNRFMIARFKKFSRGGGTWPRLKASTITKKVANKNRILVELGDLLGAMQATLNVAPRVGSLTVTAGVSDQVFHSRSNMNLAELVDLHQSGAGNLPIRRIVVPPPQRVINAMVNVGNKALGKLADKTR